MGSIFITYRKPGGYAQDDRWITVHPNGEEHEGRPVLIDDDGYVKGGMGGVWNGTKIHEAKSHFTGPRTPSKATMEGLKEWRSQKEQKREGQLLKVENGEFEHVKETLAKAGITLTEISGGDYYDKESHTTKTYTVDERCIVDAANQLLKLSNKFDITGEDIPLRFGICNFDDLKDEYKKGGKNTYGDFSTWEKRIRLNSWWCKDQDQYVNSERENCELQWWETKRWHMPCQEENLKLYTITHEFGHFMQRQVVIKELEREGIALTKINILLYEEKRKKAHKDEIIKIARGIYHERGGKGNYAYTKDISEYGGSPKRPFEFVAECFANSQLGKPNILGEAVVRWLEGKGLVKK